MPNYTTIDKHTDHFNNKLYTGDGNSTKAVTGVGFQPDWILVKPRAINHAIRSFDSIRGSNKELQTNGNNAEATDNQYGWLASFDSDGFTTQTGSDSNQYTVNKASSNYVAWNWKAGTTGSGTTTGSGYGKAYSYSVNTTAGFSIVTYKGNGSAGHTIPHHLGATPSLIILKNRDASQSWLVGMTQLGWTKNLHLNETGAVETTTNIWNDTAPTSTAFTVGTNTKCNTDDEDYIAYVFAEKIGFSKFGSYLGNGSSQGTFIYTGFKPAWVMIKRSDSSTNWAINDTARDFNGAYGNDASIYANLSDAETTSSSLNIDLLSNGMTLRSNNSSFNNGGSSYIYMAFGQSIVGSNNVCATAR